MLHAKKDEVRVILSNKLNNFLIANAAQQEGIEELSMNIWMMARIQPTIINFDEGPSYDSACINGVQNPSTRYMNLLFSDINSGSVEHNKNAHDSHDNELEQLARNACKEAEKQQILAQKVKQPNVFHKEFIEADR
nr:hypothetical protein [Tanacetum cinerariifolium]